MVAARIAFFALALVLSDAAVSMSDDDSATGVNPIRKVVTMLQNMQKKVAAEGEKEEKLYEAFMCYCKTGSGDLTESITAAGNKVPQVESDINGATAKKAELDEDLKQHQLDRSSAKNAIGKATAIREKEAGLFGKEKAELDANIGSLTKAIVAIDRGMSGGFLQTRAAQTLKRIATSVDMNDSDRQELMSFLSGTEGSDYAPKGGEISGILKNIKDDMSKSLASATSDEKDAIAAFEDMIAAKNKEIAALTKAIEEKSMRTGELAVEIVTMKNDLTDTQQALMEDRKFLADLEKNCATKTGDWEERSKTRGEELVAISETIKILNDDDALELFKKTLPGSASASLVQVSNAATMGERALKLIRALQKSATSSQPDLDFIAMAIEGKKVGFAKVIKMVDNLVASLKQEQIDDDSKQEYCSTQFDTSDDKKKDLQRTIEDHETAISEAEEGIATVKDDIKALTAGIKKLDKTAAEATEQRKAEHEEFTELMSNNNAAKEVLNFAINRLNKFYAPKLYVEPPAREVAFVQVSSVHRDNPGPAPETFGDFEKKTEESGGVVEMVKRLVKDLDKEITEAETGEEDAQKDYEEMMKDSAEKRADSASALTEKKAAKANAETDLEEHKEAKASSGKELLATDKFIGALHNECDWLMKFFDVRKQARSSEIDALGNAKAVLSGADFAFVQKRASFLQPKV